MKKSKLAVVLALVSILGCKSSEESIDKEDVETVDLDTVDVSATPEREHYNPSQTMYHDLLHTDLEVEFDYKKTYMYGKANLRLKPYFYPQDSLVLDAKGFDINRVALVQENGKKKELQYDYDNEQLSVALDKEYTRKDTFEVFVDYTAKPEELEEGGSSAITSDKGLYFINPDLSEEDKPRQIWTQGETEASSCWFPTIDQPNERMTHTIAMKVDTEYVSLSNGLLEFSEDNGDGTRTDHWVMDMPHAPYLVMMAVGDFARVNDTWTNSAGEEIEVDYFVEHEYEEYADDIFGNTPEMISLFSEQLGYEYPWQKYHQIVVRDYVSGAMENTTGVIFGEFMHKTDREMMDGDNESIIAHELIHHWFGDLVTCESWANLPLNESFATYGEYLWTEHKYGRDAADKHNQQGLDTYLQESRQKQVDMIRYDYDHREDMFDGHSYAKGGRILHMLRNYTGDDAFFASLKRYLHDNKYSPVEIDELRIAFEETTGEDMHWFFDQWFMASGHPILSINYEYDTANTQQKVMIKQKQSFETTPVYKLPIAIDVYEGGEKKRYNVVIDEVEETFTFNVKGVPDLVNVDADKMLLCQKSDNKERLSEWAFMYENAPLYLDRYEAIEKLSRYSDEVAVNTMISALNDDFWYLREFAARRIRRASMVEEEKIKGILKEMATDDEKSTVRAQAIRSLVKYFEGDDLAAVFEKGINDSSYAVMGRSLSALAEVNPDKGLEYADKFKDAENGKILLSVADIYSDYGGPGVNDFFIEKLKTVSSFDKYAFVQAYTRYLKQQDGEVIEKGIPVLADVAKNEGAWWLRLSGIQALADMESYYTNRITVLETEIGDIEEGEEGDKQQLQQQLEDAKRQKEKLEQIFEELKESEENETLKSLLGG